MTSRRLIASSAAVVAVAAAATGIAVADQSRDSTDTAGRAVFAAPPDKAPVATVPSTLQATFKLFRTTAPTTLPALLGQHVSGPNQLGLNAGLARAISTETGTGYVIPGDGFACIAVPDPVDGWAEGCSSVADAARNGLTVGLMAKSGKTIQTLVVPDGADAVKLAGAVSTKTPTATTSSVRRRVHVPASGVVSARTNAPGSLRVVR